MQVVFATHNGHKLEEAKAVLAPFVSVLSLKDIGCTIDPVEDGTSIEENAFIKSQTIWQYVLQHCDTTLIKGVFADDTGLEIQALNNQPGIHTARWAGDDKNDALNIQKALCELDGKTDRNARFRTVIAYTDGRHNVFFEGILQGVIAHQSKGTNGFGYDPIFIPVDDNLSLNSSRRTLAEMPIEEKNGISHRGKALLSLKDFLMEQSQKS